MTYSGTKEYKRKVFAQAKATGCEYVVIQHFLSDDEVADLRIITDIFIIWMSGTITACAAISLPRML